MDNSTSFNLEFEEVREEDYLLELLNRGSCSSLDMAIPGITLSYFQSMAVAWHIVTKGTIISVDTGLGKTYIAMAFAYLTLKSGGGKFIFISRKDPVMNNYEKFKKVLPEITCDYITGESDSIWKLRKYIDSEPDVIFITQDAIRDEKVLYWLYERSNKYKNLIVDEIHTAIYEDSFVFQALRAIRSRMDSIMALTATPLRVDPIQFINALHIIDEHLIPNPITAYNEFAMYDEMGKVVGFKDVDYFKSMIIKRYYSFTRAELGLANTGTPDVCTENLSEEQLAYSEDNLSKFLFRKKIRLAYDNPLLDKLIRVLEYYKSEGKKGLIYANLDEIKDHLNAKLVAAGLKSRILDGRINKTSDRRHIQDEFNASEYDCLVMNITSSLDLKCDYIIFYELTSDFEQMTGRGQRGLTQQCVDVLFCVYNTQKDIEFFNDNVYKNGLLLMEFGGKQVREVRDGYSMMLKRTGSLEGGTQYAKKVKQD